MKIKKNMLTMCMIGGIMLNVGCTEAEIHQQVANNNAAIAEAEVLDHGFDLLAFMPKNIYFYNPESFVDLGNNECLIDVKIKERNSEAYVIQVLRLNYEQQTTQVVGGVSKSPDGTFRQISPGKPEAITVDSIEDVLGSKLIDTHKFK